MHSIRATVRTHDNSELTAWIVVTYYIAPLPGTWDEPPEPEEIEWHLATSENGPISEALQYYAGADMRATHDWLSDLARRNRWGRHRHAA